MKTILHMAALLFLFGVLSPVCASPGEPGNIIKSNTSPGLGDSTKAVWMQEYILLAGNPSGLRRPKFETIHLVLGVGTMISNYSELRRGDIGFKGGDINMQISVYIQVPFQRNSPSFSFTGGWDIGIGGASTFKGTVQYRTKFGLFAGLGIGRTWYSHDNEDLIINASQTFGLVELGINLISKSTDLLLAIPLAPSLTTTFEGKNYSIKPVGIQLGLLISLH